MSRKIKGALFFSHQFNFLPKWFGSCSRQCAKKGEGKSISLLNWFSNLSNGIGWFSHFYVSFSIRESILLHQKGKSESSGETRQIKGRLNSKFKVAAQGQDPRVPADWKADRWRRFTGFCSPQCGFHPPCGDVQLVFFLTKKKGKATYAHLFLFNNEFFFVIDQVDTVVVRLRTKVEGLFMDRNTSWTFSLEKVESLDKYLKNSNWMVTDARFDRADRRGLEAVGIWCRLRFRCGSGADLRNSSEFQWLVADVMKRKKKIRGNK